MKKIILPFYLQLAVFGFQKISAQEVPDKQNMPVVTSQEPFYPKGEQALYNYVLYNTKYSEESIKKYIEGEVMLSFDVLPDSSVKNVKVISDIGYGIGDAVKNLVSTLKFAPAIQMGIPAKMNLMMNFPVKAH